MQNMLNSQNMLNLQNMSNMQNMYNMHRWKYAKYAEYASYEIFYRYILFQNMQNMHSLKYAKYTEHGSRLDVRHIFHIFNKNAKLGTQVLISWKYAGQVLILLIFESRRTNLCGLVKDFEKAWPLPWYHDGLPIAPLCASLASNSRFFKLPLSFVHVQCRSYAQLLGNDLPQKSQRTFTMCLWRASAGAAADKTIPKRMINWAKTRKLRK